MTLCALVLTIPASDRPTEFGLVKQYRVVRPWFRSKSANFNSHAINLVLTYAGPVQMPALNRRWWACLGPSSKITMDLCWVTMIVPAWQPAVVHQRSCIGLMSKGWCKFLCRTLAIQNNVLYFVSVRVQTIAEIKGVSRTSVQQKL